LTLKNQHTDQNIPLTGTTIPETLNSRLEPPESCVYRIDTENHQSELPRPIRTNRNIVFCSIEKTSIIALRLKAIPLSNEESGNSPCDLSKELSIAYTEIEELKAKLASLEDADTSTETASSVSDRLTGVLEILV
jgi:hypothetical protein